MGISAARADPAARVTNMNPGNSLPKRDDNDDTAFLPLNS
jgi:hypothetical protein